MKATPEQKPETLPLKADISTHQSGGNAVRALFLFTLFLFLLGFFSIIVLNRPADVDEGYHLVCAKSIFVAGRAPYLDFFFFQMPLLLYVYGAVMNVFGYEWQVARLLCALLASGIGVLLCKYALQKTNSKSFSIALAAMYCFAPYIFIWFTCGRTHVLSTFLLLVSVSLLRPTGRHVSLPVYAISGFFLGLSIDTRLYFLVLIPILAFHIYQTEKERRRQPILFFLGAAAAAMMINIPFMIADPLKYMLNVVGYHAMKTPEGLVGNYSQKLDLVLQTLFDYPTVRPTLYLGYIFVFAAYLANQTVRRIPFSQWNPAFYVAGTLFLVSLLPTPTLGQYFSVPIPFFLLLTVDLVQSLLEYARGPLAKRTILGIIVMGTVFFACMAIGKIDFYIFKGNNLEGSMPTEGGKEDWNLDNVQKVSKSIDRLVRPDAEVFSLWPGYLLESRVRIMPKTENVTLLEIEDELSDWIIAHAQTITDAEIKEGIRAKRIDLFIYGNSIAPHVPEYKALLTANGYTVSEKVGGILLFLSPRYEKPVFARLEATPED